MRFIQLAVIVSAILILYSCATPADSATSKVTIGGGGNTPGILPGKVTFDVPDTLLKAELKNELKNELKSISRDMFSPMRSISPNLTNGPAYRQLQDLVTMGLQASISINKILTAISAHQIYLILNAGHTYSNTTTGEWVFANLTASTNSIYLYYGTNNNVTNFYIDFTNASGSFMGTAIFWDHKVTDPFSEAFISFDQTTANPTLDIFLKPRVGNSNKLETMHVKITKTGSAEAEVATKATFAGSLYNDDYSFITGWEMVGYAKQDDTGGVKAWTMGTFYKTNDYTTNYSLLNQSNGTTNYNNYNFLTNHYDIIASNYIYEEYFDLNGNIIWRQGTADAAIKGSAVALVSNRVLNVNDTNNYRETITNRYSGSLNTPTLTTNYNALAFPQASGPFSAATYVYSFFTNSDVNYVDTNQTWTNSGPKPAAIETKLLNITRITNSEYTNYTSLTNNKPILP